MIEFNFKSQPATSIEQSERLIALGLRKETADMMHYAYIYAAGGCFIEEHLRKYHIRVKRDNVWEEIGNEHRIPAWSLHRLIEMADTTTYINEGREDEHELWFCMDKCYCWNNHESFYSTNLYDSLINCIEWLIKEGYFPKEYLEDKK